MVKNKIVKQLRHGQITIPKELREALGLEDDDLLSISLAGGKLEIEPLKVAPKTAGSPWARELYQLFAPVRKSLEGYREEEINQAVEEAVREVRSEKG
jgi:AbrB family looped-hinge helix DNA binding protein